MARHWGIGPVFARELAVGARRWQVYAMRVGFVLALLTWLAALWSSYASRTFTRANELAAVGQEFFTGMVAIQITLLLLAAPAATAGAVCVEKARGTLLHILVTDLTDNEIVVG